MRGTFGAANHDISPSGDRFVMIEDAAPGSTSAARLCVVIDWFEELRARAPK